VIHESHARLAQGCTGLQTLLSSGWEEEKTHAVYLTAIKCSNPNANNDCPREELVAVLLKVTHGKDVSKTYKNVLPLSIQ